MHSACDVSLSSTLDLNFYSIQGLKNKTDEAVSKAIADAKTEEIQKALADARADAKNLELYTDCLNRYTNAMRNTLMENDSFYSKSILDEIHENAKKNWISKVWNVFNEYSMKNNILQHLVPFD